MLNRKIHLKNQEKNDFVEIDVSKNNLDYQLKVFNNVIQKICEG